MTSITSKKPDNPGLLQTDSGCRRLAPVMRWLISYLGSGLKVWGGIVCLVLVLSGCTNEKYERSLVAPVVSTFPYEIEGTVGRSWGGDEFEIFDGYATHWVKLVGVIGPEPAQPLHRQARTLMLRKSFRKKAKVKVLSNDYATCEIGKVIVEGTDLSLYLLQQGYGWYNGADCESAESYKAAEQEARAMRIGIWQDETHINPKEFREQELERTLERLRKELKD